MKRLVLLCVLLVTLGGPLVTARTAFAADALPCDSITLDNPHSEACNSDIVANPLPKMVEPTTYDPKMDGYSRPRSVLLPDTPLRYKLGWMIHDWYYTDTPGKNPQTLDKAKFIAKATKVYVYATVKVNGLDWNMIGPDEWVPGEYIAVLNIPTRPDGVSGRWIALDLTEQTLIAMIDDKPVFTTLISAAWGGFGVTREGLFHIYARTKDMTFVGPPWAKIPEYIIPHVPWVMFFDGNIGLHGAYWHNYFGYERTHGCVNIPVADEKWLWDWVSEVSDQWGGNAQGSQFFFANPDKAPWVYVYKSNKAAGHSAQAGA